MKSIDDLVWGDRVKLSQLGRSRHFGPISRLSRGILVREVAGTGLIGVLSEGRVTYSLYAKEFWEPDSSCECCEQRQLELSRDEEG